MADITQLVERLVREQFAKKIALIALEIKELKGENQELQKKYLLLARRVRALEEATREKPNGTDFGV